jgi:hypothetical protein
MSFTRFVCFVLFCFYHQQPHQTPVVATRAEPSNEHRFETPLGSDARCRQRAALQAFSGKGES